MDAPAECLSGVGGRMGGPRRSGSLRTLESRSSGIVDSTHRKRASSPSELWRSRDVKRASDDSDRGRRRVRAVVVDRGAAGEDPGVRRHDGRPQLHPRRSRDGGADAVRRHRRARLPHALAAAGRCRTRSSRTTTPAPAWRSTTGSTRCASRRRCPRARACAARSASTRVDEEDWGRRSTMTATIEREGGEKPVCVAEVVYRYYRL